MVVIMKDLACRVILSLAGKIELQFDFIVDFCLASAI